MRYGIPFKGSKSKIAEDIISALPSGKRLVDLFGGGFAITHCALVKGASKWESFMYNDIEPLLQPLITDAINGKYNPDRFIPEWISREEFQRRKQYDGYVKWIWSFGNNGNDYLYGRKIEDDKKKAHDFVVFGKESDITEGIVLESADIHERRLEWGRKARSRLIHIERLCHLENLQHLAQLESLQRLDYREYEHRDGDVVYCDIPYEDSINPTDYGGGFNNYEFYEWARKQPYPVYFSSYPLFEEVWRKELRSVMNSAKGAVKRTEILYVS